jgi:hypothetical protein
MDLEQEKAAILQLYHRARQGHFEQDATKFPPFAQRRFRLSEGDVFSETRDAALPGLETYLKRTSFLEYVELEPPRVEVAGDASMAWLLGHIRVRARQQQPDGTESELAFRCAWVSVYTRQDGAWAEVVNASTFHEGAE